MSGTLSGTKYVGSGSGKSASDSGTTIVSGGLEYVGYYFGTGTATSTVISSGGAQHVGDNWGTGTATSTTISAGGYQYVGSDFGTGTAIDTVISGGRQFVGTWNGQGTATNTVIASGGGQILGYVSATGTATSTTIDSGGYQIVGDEGKGSAADTVISSGGKQYVGDQFGTGTATSTVISGGTQYVGYGNGTGSATSTVISSGGEQYVGRLSGTGTAVSTMISSGGAQYVGYYEYNSNTDSYAGGTGTATSTVISGGVQYVGDGSEGIGVASDTSVYSGGEQVVSAGGTATSTTVFSGGLEDVQSGGVVDAPVIDGGTLVLESGAVIATGPIAFAADTNYGTLDLTAEGSGATFSSDFTAAISGFAGVGGTSDVIEVDGSGQTGDKLVWTQDTATSGTLRVEDANNNLLETLTLDGTYSQNQFTLTESGNVDDIAYDSSAPCYCAGTRIATENGEVAVEDLQVGDRVVTASGALRPVVWIGHRAIDIRRHPAPVDVWPVRIAAHAFGEDLPRRDLWVSPGHNVAWAGALMPACALANGISVARIEVAKVDYWHVELDAHDLMLAEGLPAESYLDCGNRTDFVNGGAFVVAHPDFQPKHLAQTCLPLVHAGPELVAAKSRLMERLRARGFEIDDDAQPHIIADGERITPIRMSEFVLVFVLPGGRQNIVLMSNGFVPAHALPESTDMRRLGLSVGRLQIDGAEIALGAGAELGAGWHEAEEQADGRLSHRWTDGAAVLPSGARRIVLELADRGRYWRNGVENVVALFG